MLSNDNNRSKAQRKRIVFCAVAVFWLVFDMISKHIANSHDVGIVFAGPFLNMIDFRLIHNTGAAWGIFSDSTFVLGIFSLVVCAVVLLLAFINTRNMNIVSMASLGLVFAGGIGNAIDRFANGYVIDFINPIFISFPTFNIADIGITCGLILFVISYAFSFDSESKVRDSDDDPEVKDGE